MVALAAVVLTGCVTNGGTGVTDPTSNTTTLEDAKAFTIEVQTQLASYIPEDKVATRRDITKAHLLRCPDGEYEWPGGVRIELTGTIDQQSVLDAIRSDFGDRPEWTVESLDAAPGFVLRHENTSEFFADFPTSGEFRVLSFSACFPFDPELGGRY